MTGDVTAAHYIARIIAALCTHKIGALAHAAGVPPSMADGKRVLDINFTATTRLAEKLLPHMAPGGVAILIASNSDQTIAGPLFDNALKRSLRAEDC